MSLLQVYDSISFEYGELSEPLYHTELNPTEPATYFNNDIWRYKMYSNS